MEIDPFAATDVPGADDAADAPAADRAAHDARAQRLNTWVALTVAILSSFIGVCKVKDDNVVQAMQQAQADRIDDWSYYQAKNVRAEVAHATADELRALHADAGAVARYDSLAANEDTKREQIRRKAEGDQTTYDALNYRDDQFDLSDTLAAIAVSLLAMTSLTQKRWLYATGAVFAALGVLMGLAGLLGWHLHPDMLARLLS